MGTRSEDWCLKAVIMRSGLDLYRQKACLTNLTSSSCAVPLKVEQAQLDTLVDMGRWIVEIGKPL
jgi:hypothetical protein